MNLYKITFQKKKKDELINDRVHLEHLQTNSFIFE